MQSLGYDELTSRIIKSLKSFNFFIFHKDLYPNIVSLLKKSNIVRSVRISELDSSRYYFILEPDITLCNHTCRSKCSSSNSLDSRCFTECLVICKSSLIDTIVNALNNSYNTYKEGNVS
ncbi:MAG: hypothetical protein LM560_04160 [Desulfurococcaceae archaeon]|nr:hypothetical protein [Desulfurococcaceae archaeon]